MQQPFFQDNQQQQQQQQPQIQQIQIGTQQPVQNQQQDPLTLVKNQLKAVTDEYDFVDKQNQQLTKELINTSNILFNVLSLVKDGNIEQIKSFTSQLEPIGFSEVSDDFDQINQLRYKCKQILQQPFQQQQQPVQQQQQQQDKPFDQEKLQHENDILKRSAQQLQIALSESNQKVIDLHNQLIENQSKIMLYEDQRKQFQTQMNVIKTTIENQQEQIVGLTNQVQEIMDIVVN